MKKNVYKNVKVCMVATIAAFGIAVGAGKGGTPVLAAQNYITDSTSYHLNLDTDDVWRVYDANGNVASDYDGLVCNEFGWWKCANGSVDFSFNGLAENEFGWWNLVDGRVDFTSNDIVNNEFGWWKVTNGAVDFGFTGLAANRFGWWNLVDGRVDFTSNDIVNNEFGWWKVTNGAVDFGFNGLAANQFGWWKIAGGAVDFGFTGVATNEFGSWYVENGLVRLDYSCGIYREWSDAKGDFVDAGHTITYDGVEYRVENGRAIRQGKRYIVWHDLDGSDLGTDVITVDVDENGNMVQDKYMKRSDTDRSSECDRTMSRFYTAMIGSPDGLEWWSGSKYTNSNFNLKDYGETVQLYLVYCE